MSTTISNAPASTTLDLTGLPEPVIRSLKLLVESLRVIPTLPKVDTPDPLTEARNELHREIMENFEKKWAMYGPYREESK